MSDKETLRWHYDAANRETTRAFGQIQRAEEALSINFRRMEDAGKLTHDSLLSYLQTMVTQQQAAKAYIERLEADILVAKQQIAVFTEGQGVIERTRDGTAAELNQLRFSVTQLRELLETERSRVAEIAGELNTERERTRVLTASVTHLKEELKNA